MTNVSNTHNTTGSDDHPNDPVPRNRQLDPRTIASTTIQALYDGPKSSAELSSNRFSIHHKDLIGRLKPPKGGRGEYKSRGGDWKTARAVYYLYGDERRAVRRFIDVNESLVQSCIQDGNNPLVAQWDPVLYQILCEEWQLRAAARGDE